MAFDGAFLSKIVAELQTAIDSHIDKIYQPSKDELVFLLRKKGFTKRLLISVRQGVARIHFTENRYENPQTPPMFCMLIRKHLSAARLISVSQPQLERIVTLDFSATNELGDIVNIKLICEFTGIKTNIILLGSDDRIIDCLRHSDPESEGRLLLPNAKYEYPQGLNKLNPLMANTDKILEKIEESNHGDLAKAILNTIDGFSPLVSREIAENSEKIGLKNSIDSVLEDLKGPGKPILLLKEDKTPFDYSYTDIKQYGDTVITKVCRDFSNLLDEFYTAKDNAERIRRSANDIIKLVTNLRSRTEKKLALRLEELEKCNNRESLRIYGELIKSNLYMIEKGSSFAEVPNYYDEMKLVRIPLISSISPSKNAARYFKEYKKTYTAEQTLRKLTAADKEELIYFDSVLDNISRSESLTDINEIREELALAGYIKTNLSQRKKPSNPTKFTEYTSLEGYRILVGKNNKQNDYITTKLAGKTDIWFHVKNIPGSHVVILCNGGEVKDETLLYAATLAAANSKAAQSSQVPVDYTYIKYVKKPASAKPGMVIYTTNKTVFVNPNSLKEEIQ